MNVDWSQADDEVSVGSLEQYRRNQILNDWWRGIERADRRWFIAQRVSRNLRRRYRLTEEKVNA